MYCEEREKDFVTPIHIYRSLANDEGLINIDQGACQKVVCEKCFDIYEYRSSDDAFRRCTTSLTRSRTHTFVSVRLQCRGECRQREVHAKSEDQKPPLRVTS